MNQNIKMPSDNGKFIEILSDKVIYGGNQGNFSNENYRKNGCGCIAAANVITYIKSVNPKYFKKKIAVHTHERKLKISDYMLLADDISKMMRPDITGIELIFAFKRYTGNFLAYCPLIITKRNKLIKKISKSLLNDIPVIISVYDISRTNKGFKIYSDKNLYTTVNKHYMTITEINYYNDEIFITLSSWGRKYKIRLDELYEKSYKNIINGLFTGIFVPKKI